MQESLGTCFTEHDTDHAWFVTTTHVFRATPPTSEHDAAPSSSTASRVTRGWPTGPGSTGRQRLTPGPDTMRLRQRSERPPPAEQPDPLAP